MAPKKAPATEPQADEQIAPTEADAPEIEQAAPTTEEAPPAEGADIPKPERRFPVAALRRNARHDFGISTTTFNAIMRQHEGEMFTLTEANSMIQEWLHKEVR